MKTVSQDLTHEHKAIQVALNILEIMYEKLEKESEADYIEINDLLEFLKEFADKCHHGKEEGFLFPALEKTGVRNHGGPIGAMLSEHTLGRDLIKQMQDNLLKNEVDSQGFVEAAKSYVRLLRAHIQKENTILFPLIEVKMSASEQAELLRSFENHEEEVIGEGRHEELNSMLETFRDKYLL